MKPSILKGYIGDIRAISARLTQAANEQDSCAVEEYACALEKIAGTIVADMQTEGLETGER